jgi:hypothetical protein
MAPAGGSGEVARHQIERGVVNPIVPSGATGFFDRGRDFDGSHARIKPEITIVRQALPGFESVVGILNVERLAAGGIGQV